MKTAFGEVVVPFLSASQAARVETEAWAGANMFCPNCGCASLSPYPANRPVADFFCASCHEQYELKSHRRAFGRKVVDGAYHSKMERLSSDTSPNLILLRYNQAKRQVEDLTVVPKFFFAPHIIERRKPLAPTARRAGWVGSNILLDRIPASGKVPVIQRGLIRDRNEVLNDWSSLKFVERRIGEARGWLLEVLWRVERIARAEFSLMDVYAFENELVELFPNNNNVRPKIRQQLQILRDAGCIRFLGGGQYQLVK